MVLNVNRYVCGYCGACVAVCPHCVLELVETWLEIGSGCTECGTCVKICPVGALSLDEVKA